MDVKDETARSRYRVRILPAGRNDRMIEISDTEGNPLKYVYSPHSLGNSVEEYLDHIILDDLERMAAGEFARRYGIDAR